MSRKTSVISARSAEINSAGGTAIALACNVLDPSSMEAALAGILDAWVDFNDKEALTVDTFPDSPYRGRIYVAWDINVADASGENVIRQDLVVARSEDGGESYRRARLVRSGATVVVSA